MSVRVNPRVNPGWTHTTIGRLALLDPIGGDHCSDAEDCVGTCQRDVEVDAVRLIGVTLSLDERNPAICAFLAEIAARQRAALRLARLRLRREPALSGPSRRHDAARGRRLRVQPLLEPGRLSLRMLGPVSALRPALGPESVEARAAKWRGQNLRAALSLQPVFLMGAGIVGLEAHLLRLEAVDENAAD